MIQTSLNEIVFHSNQNITIISIKNIAQGSILYKIKTNFQQKIDAKPYIGQLSQNETVDIKVSMKSKLPQNQIVKLQILTTQIKENSEIDNISNFWKTVPKNEIKEKLLIVKVEENNYLFKNGKEKTESVILQQYLQQKQKQQQQQKYPIINQLDNFLKKQQVSSPMSPLKTSKQIKKQNKKQSKEQISNQIKASKANQGPNIKINFKNILKMLILLVVIYLIGYCHGWLTTYCEPQIPVNCNSQVQKPSPSQFDEDI